MAYTLFKVNYADRYRGMDAVILDGYGDSAEVTLTADEGGIWHTPGHWIDSVAHIAGFIVNGSDASNTADYFFATPSREGMHFVQPLEPGAHYHNYIKILPTGEKGCWAGDVYILQDDTVVGMVGQIQFRQFPRLLMDRFFSPGEGVHATEPPKPQPEAAPAPVAPAQVVPAPAITAPAPVTTSAGTPAPSTAPTAAATAADPGAKSAFPSKIYDIVAAETGLKRSSLAEDALFTSPSVDSLMSLVLAEKFKAQLKIHTKSSPSLECPTIGDFHNWLEGNK